MAITPTLLTSGEDGWNTAEDGTVVSPSITPGTDCALVLEMGAISGLTGLDSLFGVGCTVVSSGSGPTWIKQSFSVPGTAYDCIASVWTAVIGGSDPGGFTITVDFAGAAIAGAYTFAVHRFTGHDTGTPFGGKVTTTHQAGNGAVTATLDAAPASGDYTVALSIADNDSGPGGAAFDNTTDTWTETVDGAGSGDRVTYNAGYRTASTSASVPWADVNTGADNFSSAQAAIVVKAAGGGGAAFAADPPLIYSQAVQRAAYW